MGYGGVTESYYCVFSAYLIRFNPVFDYTTLLDLVTLPIQILKYLRYVVKQIFVFCTFRRNAMFVSKCLGMFFGVKLFA